MIRDDPAEEAKVLSHFLAGMASVYKTAGQGDVAAKLTKASEFLEDVSRNVCGDGYIGCPGGKDCDSDHK